jgi:hypothetical protein
VLSWIFRYRQRLTIIYGRVAPAALAGERFRGTRTEGFEELGPRSPVRPGRLAWRGQHLVVAPMPRLR